MDACNTKLSWAFSKKPVLCVGNAVIDCISIVRRFPKLTKSEKCIKSYWQGGGHAVNTATTLRTLGVHVEFFGVLSSSPMFSILLNEMRQRGIEIDNCPRCGNDPPFSTVIIAKSTKTCTIVNCNPSFPYVTIKNFKKLDLSKYGWIHFRGKQPRVTLEMMKTVEAHNAANPHEANIVISMDFDGSLKHLWELVDYCEYIIFSKQVAIDQKWNTPKEALANIDELLNLRFGINLKRPFVAFLWDLDGTGLLDLKSNFSMIPPYKPKKIIDSLGFGEVFVGAFIYAVYVRERSEAVAADFANRLASHKCTKCGYDHLADIVVPPAL